MNLNIKIIFIFAHPDDETFSSGGTIAKLTKEGAIVKLITATRGEAGLIGNPPVCSKENLGKYREKELRKAAKILGIAKIYFLGHIDGTLPKVPEKILSHQILNILKKENPNVVITFSEDGGSKHPDHIYISKTATIAFKEFLKTSKKHVSLYYTSTPESYVKKMEKEGIVYSAFGKITGIPDNLITTKVSIKKTLDKKMEAVRAHRTQNQDWERIFKRKNFPEFKFEFFRLILEKDLH